MNRRWALALLAACSASKPGAAPDAITDTTPPTGDGTVITASCNDRKAQPLDADWTVDVSGVKRVAHVHVPASYDPQHPTPVVINIHGLNSNGTQEEIISGMIAKSDSAGFIAVHPESNTSPGSWNAGPGCCSPANQNNNDDVGFIRGLLDQLEAQLCVDTDRVYTTGLSNGGYMSHRLACDLSDRFAAIGSVAGLLGVSTCNATRAMPVWDIHGNADPIVSYSYTGQTIDFWTQHNKCSTETTTYQNGSVTCVTHGGCSDGADVVFCTVANGGHQWPGGTTIPLLGNNTNDINATDAQWEFFLAHPR